MNRFSLAMLNDKKPLKWPEMEGIHSIIDKTPIASKPISYLHNPNVFSHLFRPIPRSSSDAHPVSQTRRNHSQDPFR